MASVLMLRDMRLFWAVLEGAGGAWMVRGRTLTRLLAAGAGIVAL